MTEGLIQGMVQDLSRNAGCVKVTRDLQISIPSSESERVMAIRCADWKRLDKRLEDAVVIPTDFSTLYGILFGLSGSAWLAVIPLAHTEDLPAWVLPTSIAIAFGTFILGCFVVCFSRVQRKTRKTMMTTLIDDVRDIGSRFTEESTGGGEGSDDK